MTIGVSSAFIAEFSSDVKHAYQSMGRGLLERVRVQNDVKAATYKFHKMGKGVASEHIPQADVTPMNVGNSSATATLKNYVAPEYSGVFDLEKISYNERDELVKVVAGAINRRAEQLILDALDAGASSTQVTENFGGTGSGVTVTKLRRLKRLMDAAGVPKEDRTFVHDSIGLEQLLGSTAVTSSDYNQVKALVHGELDTYMGFKFILVEDRTEGGIVTTANVTKNFGFHKDAIGIAIGHQFDTEVNYIAQKVSWLINGRYSAGAVGIDDTGIYELLSNNTYVL